MKNQDLYKKQSDDIGKSQIYCAAPIVPRNTGE